jgi:1-deoxy-D-xylulose-5-phosphate reductoisomerase
MKTIIILGSTGSIGTNTLDIVQRFPSEFRVAGLTAGNNIDKLEEQIRAFAPRVVAVSQEAAAATLRQRCAGLPVEILSGEAGIAQVASLPEAELVISAIVGAAGLVPTLTAIRSGKHIALANKEPMVMAGKLMQDEAHKHNVRIFPVDSEHSAIFQSLEGHRLQDVRRLILTASGGALWTVAKDDLQHGAGAQTPQLENGLKDYDRLRHPDEQRARGRRSPLAVRYSGNPHRSHGAPGKHYSLAG